MTSFFRKRIAQKVVPLLQKTHGGSNTTSIVSSLVKVDKVKRKQPQLILPWEKVKNIFTEANNTTSLKDLVKLLRNQGLPTSEGFIDINECDSPLGIAFTVDKHVFSKVVLMDICINEGDISKTSCLFEDIIPKTTAIMCGTPAIGESFQIRHFRWALHSDFIANINNFVGHDVVKISHVQDWGLSSAILLQGCKKFGTASELQKNPNVYFSEVMKASELEYDNNLDFKKAVIACYEKMEEGDQEILSEWNELKSCAFQHHDLIYKRLSCSFDDTHFDSLYSQEIKNISEELLKKGLVSIEKTGKMKMNSTTESGMEDFDLYEKGANSALNLLSGSIFAAALMKQKHNFDTMYFVAPAFSKDFFELFFCLMKKMGYEWTNQMQHLKIRSPVFGVKRTKILGTEGVLNKIKASMLEKLEQDLRLDVNERIQEVAEILGVTSLCINDMKYRRNVEYKFKWEDVVNFGRDSGASFQFCHAGLEGLQADSKFEFKIDIDTSPLLEQEAHDLIRHLSRFDEMINKSYRILEPCIILQYLSTLWYFVDRAANVLKLDIKEERLTVIKARLLLLSATLKVLRKGFHLLGITPLGNNYFKNV